MIGYLTENNVLDLIAMTMVYKERLTDPNVFDKIGQIIRQSGYPLPEDVKDWTKGDYLKVKEFAESKIQEIQLELPNLEPEGEYRKIQTLEILAFKIAIFDVRRKLIANQLKEFGVI